MKFNLDDTVLNIEILGYRRSSVSGWMDEWCDVYISIKSRYINYETAGKLMLCNEVEGLFEKLCRLKNGQLPKREHIFLAEPVLEFRLRPAVETEDGGADIDMYMIFNVADDHDVVTANSIQLLFDRDNIEEFRQYLKLIIAEALLAEEKTEVYDFEYYVGYGDGNYSHVHVWQEELSSEEARIIDEGIAKGLHLEEMEKAKEIYKRIENKIKNIEGDNLRDAEIWTEEYFNEYGTDDPFEVFELVIDVKDR